MKKLKFIGSLFLIVIFLTVGCTSKKTPVDSAKFKEIMESEGLEIVDVKEQFSNSNEILEANVAVSEGFTYQIEFYVLDSNENAIDFYNYNKEIFEDSKTSVSSYKSAELGNYSKYILNNNGKYKVLSRIDNTVIYLDADKEYEEKIIEHLKKLGY